MSVPPQDDAYANTSLQLFPQSPILAESDSRVYLTLVGQTTSMGPHMQSLLATFGDLKLFRVVGMHYKVSVLPSLICPKFADMYAALPCRVL